MATYMYTSASSHNWDDDNEDFESSAYEGASVQFSTTTLANARFALQQSQPAVEDERESTQSLASTAAMSHIDFDVDPDEYPTYAEHMTEFWGTDYCRRPAYIDLSYENGYSYPDQRRRYNANWMATKLRMGGNIKNTMMMRPSPLRLSKTWTYDGEGEYIDHRGYMSPSLPTPRLSHGHDSDEERDEAQTPLDFPPIVQATDCKVDIEEYDPVTGVIDLPTRNIEAMEAEMAREFAHFSGIAVGLAVEDILSQVEQDVPCSEPALGQIVSNFDARPIVGLTTTITEATQITSPLAKVLASNATADYNKISHGKDDAPTVLADSIFLSKTTTRATHVPSPDLKYIQDSTNTLLVRNTVAAGWFTLSSLPWTRIAVAAAGALVDVVAFVALR